MSPAPQEKKFVSKGSGVEWLNTPGTDDMVIDASNLRYSQPALNSLRVKAINRVNL